MLYADSVDSGQTDQGYSVCHSTKNFKKQLHKKQKKNMPKLNMH